ncbi:hypothetical protein NG798_06510 [Ancylothrix sp. C2]|uniref:hypothetical protein n=1 Tax=Ancylothrix sp. D3o TaxID=2953691 RepID=UPI0021BAEE93|nr:hypothetical protein [Ancylothrix sp. D3o]MCT7949431.1 hypothetical protein [Ancylothrix sp. D3o]
MLQTEKNSHFQKALEILESLTLEEQEVMVNILQNRIKQQRRAELVNAVNESRQEYAQGKVKTGSIADLLAELDS